MTGGVAGHEVITTPMTFVSTNHAILYNNAIPVFADIQPDTLNIDPAQAERKVTKRTRAIVIVHFGGHACDMDAILEIADRHGLIVIEDCAHAAGGMFKNRPLGGIGDYGCFSFHAVKNLATGDGGMVTTKNADLDARLRRLRWLGISKGTWDRTERVGYSWEYDVDEIGFKCHMNDIAAALGLAQFERLAELNARRRALVRRYQAELADLAWIELPVEKAQVSSAWHNYVLKVLNPADRDPLIDFLRVNGIATGVHYIPNHLYKVYKPYVSSPLPVAESVWKRLVTLPLFPDLTDQEHELIVKTVHRYEPFGHLKLNGVSLK
jgi:perosamine synthetase